jgi:kynurenine 3-monooxygenase
VTAPRIVVVGGGLAGSLIAVMLARRGQAPIVVEREAASVGARGGRSINLALAARGIAALERAGLSGEIEPLLVPMRGRMIHEAGLAERFAAYGRSDSERIYSVSREHLNVALRRSATELGVEYRFGLACEGVDAATGTLAIAGADGNSRLPGDFVIAADGAGSAVRRSLADAGRVRVTEALLDHGYKEFTIPPAADGSKTLSSEALHIWPRGGFMLIALPNVDGSFTATLFMPLEGSLSFASIGVGEIGDVFAAEFADALPLLPDLERDYATNPTGVFGSVECRPWSAAGRVLLIGDAAHAIVPFHGQGMNAAFEDCAELDALIAEHDSDWPQICTEFERRRIDNARAIAAMALENYLEMRDHVRDPKFQIRHDLGFELERRFPGRFIPRYSMVMFHPEIPYAEAERRGAIQREILDDLARGAKSLDDVDFAAAERLIRAQL